MTTRRTHSRSVGQAQAPGTIPAETLEAEASGSGIGRSNTTGRSTSGTLKKRFGSIRRRKQDVEA